MATCVRIHRLNCRKRSENCAIKTGHDDNERVMAKDKSSGLVERKEQFWSILRGSGYILNAERMFLLYQGNGNLEFVSMD